MREMCEEFSAACYSLFPAGRDNGLFGLVRKKRTGSVEANCNG